MLTSHQSQQYTPQFLKEKIEYLKKLELEKVKTYMDIAIYGYNTYNYPIAEKYISKVEEIVGDDNIDVLLNKIKIHVLIQPHKIEKDLDKLEDLINKFCEGDMDIINRQMNRDKNMCNIYRKNLAYVKGLYYFSTGNYKLAHQTFESDDVASLIYKEISRYIIDKDKVDFKKYRINSRILNDFNFFLQVVNTLKTHALYDEEYNYIKRNRKNYEKNRDIKFIIDLYVNDIYREKGLGKKGYENSKRMYNEKPSDENVIKNLHCFANGVGDFETFWKLERTFNRNIVNAIVGHNIEPFNDLVDSMDGKKILLVTDQGFGDNFMNFRYIKEFVDKHPNTEFYFMIYPELIDLFKRNIPNRVKTIEYNISMEKFDSYKLDRYIYVSRIPMIMDVRIEDIKELDRKTIFEIDNPIEYDRDTIGIVWKTNIRSIDTRHRSYELEDFLNKIDIDSLKKKYSIISLQKDVTEHEKEILDRHNIEILDNKLTSFYESARYIKNLKELYTIDTGIMHLGGVMKVPIMMYLNKFRDCKWSNSEFDNNHFLYQDLKISQ